MCNKFNSINSFSRNISFSQNINMNSIFKSIVMAGCLTLSFFYSIEGSAAQYKRIEQMTDRCSGDVIIVPRWNAPMTSDDAVYLKRGGQESWGWTGIFPINNRQIRWYCNSKAGFLAYLDPGVWFRPKENFEKKCAEAAATSCGTNPSYTCLASAAVQCLKQFNFGLSEKNGWFPERSRCKKGATHIRAHLGPKRLLRIDCFKRSN